MLIEVVEIVVRWQRDHGELPATVRGKELYVLREVLAECAWQLAFDRPRIGSYQKKERS